MSTMQVLLGWSVARGWLLAPLARRPSGQCTRGRPKRINAIDVARREDMRQQF
jgi:hypothetical protein